MTELTLGQATIVYEDPDEGTTELTVDDEHLVYTRDHWAVRIGTDDEGNDLMRQIPRGRVYYVDRDVEHFEDRVATVRTRVESMARDLRERIPVDVGEGSTGTPSGAPEPEGEPITIQVDEEE